MDEKRRRVREGLLKCQRLPEDVNFQKLGLVLRCARKLERLTQAQAAEKAGGGLDAKTWSLIETGRRFPDDHFSAMSQAVGGYPGSFTDLSRNLPESRELAERLVTAELRLKKLDRKVWVLERRVEDMSKRLEIADKAESRLLSSLRDFLLATGWLEEIVKLEEEDPVPRHRPRRRSLFDYSDWSSLEKHWKVVDTWDEDDF